MIFDPIIHLFLIKVNRNQGRSRPDDVRILGQFSKLLANAAVTDKDKPPRLVVEAGRRPNACLDDAQQQGAFNRLRCEFADAPTRSDRFLDGLVHISCWSNHSSHGEGCWLPASRR